MAATTLKRDSLTSSVAFDCAAAPQLSPMRRPETPTVRKNALSKTSCPLALSLFAIEPETILATIMLGNQWLQFTRGSLQGANANVVGERAESTRRRNHEQTIREAGVSPSPVFSRMSR